MKPKRTESLMWALYDENGLSERVGTFGERRPCLYRARQGARDFARGSERVRRVRVIVEPVEE